MSSIFVLWILGNIFACGNSRQIDETIGNLISDITSSLVISSSFTAFFCTDTENVVKFSKDISEKYLLHKIVLSFNQSELIHQRVSHNHYFVVDFDCADSADFLLQAHATGSFIAPAKWLILQDLRRSGEKFPDLQSMTEIYEEKLMSVFENLKILPDSEVVVSQRQSEIGVRLVSLYRPTTNHRMIIENRGSWDNTHGLHLLNPDQSSRRRVNLHGTVLKTSLVLTDINTLHHLTDYQDKLIDAVTKASYMWVIYLSERMNATFTYTVEHTWGYKDENGTWSGMIGLLDRGEIDIGGTATFMIPQRLGVVDYVQLYTPTGSRFMFRRPPLSYISNIFSLPFAASVWIAILIFLTISFGFLYVTMMWEWEKTKSIPPDQRLPGDLETKPTITDNLLVLLGSFFQQGFYCEPRTISARVVVLMVLLLALSLYAAYTANIVALLQSTADSIKTLEDLMNSPLKIGIFDIVYSRYFFGAFEDPVRKEFYERMVKDKPAVWMPLEEGIRRVKEGLFAFHVDMGFGYQTMQETFDEVEKCGLEEIDYFKMYDPLLIIERQSPYREIIRVGALWLAETGLKPRVASKLFTQKPSCTGSTSFVSVGIIDCYAAMLAIVYGAIISLGIFLLEKFWRKWIAHYWEEGDSSLPQSSMIEVYEAEKKKSSSMDSRVEGILNDNFD